MHERHDAYKAHTMSDASRERVALLMEEAAEVIVICGKILRHGWDSHNPLDTHPETNRELLAREVADFNFALELMDKAEELHPGDVAGALVDARANKRQWLHFQGDVL